MERHNEEIISPASYVTSLSVKLCDITIGYRRPRGKKADTEDRSPQDDDGIQFYRRIRVICTNLGGSALESEGVLAWPPEEDHTHKRAKVSSCAHSYAFLHAFESNSLPIFIPRYMN
jgi:hypothetical protein